MFLLVMYSAVCAQPNTGTPTRNDHLFPSAPIAKPFIDYDARGFLINGKRTFIVSASMEYSRVPRALWHDRLLRLKRAGFNAIEMYTFWNYHEPKEGQFNFTGDHDLDAYLKLIKSMGMYAIVRVGPYYCGEWDMGGYPIWLRFKKDLRVRENNPQFLTAVDHYFERLMPIVSQNQINHGGAVIMVQLENEHRAGWGTVMPDNYFKHLRAKSLSLGLQVPYFFSGLHSGNDPASDYASLDDPDRPNPWFSAEYWGVWFLNYGPQETDSTLYDRRTWKIIAHGGNGYNIYMAHGGSNFDYNNDRDNAASYDYGAAIGQTGDLRPIYYSFKRANWFARSFQSVLENSLDEQQDKPTVSDTIIKVTARKSPAGTIAFLDNPDSVAVKFEVRPPASVPVKTSIQIKLAAGEIMPLVQNYVIAPNIKLVWAPTRIYSVIPQGKTTTLLVYGDVGSKAQLYFTADKEEALTADSVAFGIDNGLIEFNTVIGAKPSSYSFIAGKQTIKIITADNDLATHSWFDDANSNIIIGPDYLADATASSVTIERPWQIKKDYHLWIYKPDDPIVELYHFITDPHPQQLKSGAWQVMDASSPASPNYNDKAWLHTTNPQQMGADGDVTAYAWYRTKIKVNSTGQYLLQLKKAPEGGAIFLDGKRVDTSAFFPDTVYLTISAGKMHTLAIFTSHIGRNKLIFKIGEIDTLDRKGIWGKVTLQKADGKTPPIIVNNWRMKGGPCNDAKGDGCIIGFDNEKQQWPKLPATTSRKPQFYRSTLNLTGQKYSNAIWRVNTTSLSSGSVWVNGHNLGRYPEKIKVSGMYLPNCWLKPGKNTVVIFDENGVLPNKVAIEAEEAAGRDTQTLQF
ncbi:beta-galactosidase [Mucilaginibacter sp. dw_454]|uniref:beta-galactosidase n=1 Tax=Mucilaginibacter sp. dw_454 TaxID=2720079 RepID=UPI001BD2B3F9|nr:beta-galactosidase [Mucilaginibacter sp. dw_454]